MHRNMSYRIENINIYIYIYSVLLRIFRAVLDSTLHLVLFIQYILNTVSVAYICIIWEVVIPNQCRPVWTEHCIYFMRKITLWLPLLMTWSCLESKNLSIGLTCLQLILVTSQTCFLPLGCTRTSSLSVLYNMPHPLINHLSENNHRDAQGVNNYINTQRAGDIHVTFRPNQALGWFPSKMISI